MSLVAPFRSQRTSLYVTANHRARVTGSGTVPTSSGSLTGEAPGGSTVAPPPALAATPVMVDGMASQLVSVLLAVVIARRLDLVEFGRFSAVFAAFLVAQVVWRAFVVEPFIENGVVGETGLALRSLWKVLLLKVAVPLSGLLGLVSAAATGVAKDTLLLFAIIAPTLVGFDAVRAVNLATGSGGKTVRAAIVFSGSFTVLFATGIVAAGDVGADGTFRGDFVLGLGAGALLASGAGLAGHVWAARPVPKLDPADPLPRPRRGWRVARIPTGGSTLPLALIVLAASVGVEVSAGIHGGLIMVYPLMVIVGLVNAIPIRSSSVVGSAITMVLVGGAIAIAVTDLADSYGPAILGATWASAHSAVAPLAVAIVAGAVQARCDATIRGKMDTTLTMRARLILLAGTLAVGAIGVRVGGVSGAAWGLAIASILVAAVWIVVAIRLRGPREWVGRPES